MCFSLALAPYSSLDRADNGGHILELPLEYDDYFRLFDNPLNHPLSSTRYIGDGEEYVALDPVFTELLIRWGINLARKIAAASYGGQLPFGYCGLGLWPNSLQELGVVLPPLIELFELFAESEHPFERALPVAETEHWLRVLRDNATRTRDWILDAQRRSLMLGPHSHWNFDAVICTRGAGCQCHSSHDHNSEDVRSDHARYSPSNPVLTPYLLPHYHDHRSNPYANDTNALGLNLSAELDDHSDSDSLTESYFSVASSVEHPVCRRPPTPVQASPAEDATLADNACRALISHPVLGPGALNALVLYRHAFSAGTSDPGSSEVFRSPPPSPSLPSSRSSSVESSPPDDGRHEPHGLGSPKYHLAKRLRDSLFPGDLNDAPLVQVQSCSSNHD